MSRGPDLEAGGFARPALIAVIALLGALRLCNASEAQSSASGEASAAQHPIPSSSAQASSLAAIKEAFQPYPPPTLVEKISLARRLLRTGAGEKKDLTGQYVMLQEAATIASGCGDAYTALNAVDTTAAIFWIDAQAQTLVQLKRMSAVALSPTATTGFVNASLDLGYRAIATENFDNADRAAALVQAFSHSSENAALLQASELLAAEVRRARTESAAAKLAARQLKADPRAAAANLTQGQYRCFWQGAWAAGLALLAQSSDAPLKAVAAADMAHPTGSSSQFDVAENWRAVLVKETGLPALHIRERALMWYTRALPGLKGLQKTLALKRIAELQRLSATPGDAGYRKPLIYDWKQQSQLDDWTCDTGKMEIDVAGLALSGTMRLRFDVQPSAITLDFTSGGCQAFSFAWSNALGRVHYPGGYIGVTTTQGGQDALEQTPVALDTATRYTAKLLMASDVSSLAVGTARASKLISLEPAATCVIISVDQSTLVLHSIRMDFEPADASRSLPERPAPAAADPPLSR